QLQLLPQKTQLQLQVSAEDFNRPLQFVSAVNATQSRTTATDSAASVQAVQQAWRHLLPLLPTKPDALASLPELPEPVQQILQMIRHSQIDGQKVFSSSQVMMQLQSLLQFQPLQPAVNTQNSGGALAVAIQLLLGNLMQKQPQSTSQSANPRLAQLVANLEPAQASSLLRQLASHSATLQHSQLATLDTNTASQQQILLQLPLQQNEQSVFSQIQLEQRDADGKQAQGKEKLWQLTMKFDLQQLGPLLVVAKLQQQQLQLQFFTEQALAKRLADKFLPILKDRCSMQGLQVHQAECILGKIPDSLLPRANSLLAIKV
ncbi:MAG TPA: flagellar hook-length control protein FliK, partial [Rheinheimera sp.]|nr:flagellar hook-length control protein FliK [Rheinheimera sp.]